MNNNNSEWIDKDIKMDEWMINGQTDRQIDKCMWINVVHSRSKRYQGDGIPIIKVEETK